MSDERPHIGAGPVCDGFVTPYRSLEEQRLVAKYVESRGWTIYGPTWPDPVDEAVERITDLYGEVLRAEIASWPTALVRAVLCERRYSIEIVLGSPYLPGDEDGRKEWAANLRRHFVNPLKAELLLRELTTSDGRGA